MTGFDSNLLDELIHSKLRLGIMSMLVSVEYAEFSIIKNKLQATDGNLSANLRKLEEAGYIGVEKTFVDRKPQSRYSITDKGRTAFENYIANLEKLIKN
ncbi:MAG TPA: transcriptional regulator [Clostridiales bacterium]|jgi:DNA-binding MarR family transcriptional regulator|nr:transcriptional regulator [Clostridiales bacterium]HQP68862.1 transcriptional regulator [Clostridiales bacterium]